MTRGRRGNGARSRRKETMTDAPENNDERLDDIQERVDEIREHLPDTPGTTAIDEDEVQPIFKQDEGEAHAPG